jgi:hypothetical protein
MRNLANELGQRITEKHERNQVILNSKLGSVVLAFIAFSVIASWVDSNSQMAAGGLGTAAIPSLVGILARRTALEVIPVCLLVLFAALLALYAVARRNQVPK